MSALLPPLPLFGAFLAASLILAVTPGPGVLYIVTRSIAQGRKSGLTSVAGVALGNLGNAAGAALGLAALFAVSSLAFAIVKYAGAAYLIYLGLRTLCAPRSPLVSAKDPGPSPPSRIFRDGFVVALLNPKTTLFFAAFLPQFLPASHASVAQPLALGVIFVLIAAITDSLYALAAGSVKPWLAGGNKLRGCGRFLTGSIYIGLGLVAAFADPRAKN